MENNSGQAHDQCGSPEHGLHRRRFLEGLGGGVGAISAASWAGLFSNPVFAEQTKRKQKRCILLG
ncbi:MAG: twin-arginine translocation signal domain-containing protein, partial [Verrucomicrobiales bacterium]|nr:twin-arginine translocation signal domain-containing protein [Verrucomicrobiales bacterium]